MRESTIKFVNKVNESLMKYGKSYTVRTLEKLFEDDAQAQAGQFDASAMAGEWANIYNTIQEFFKKYQNSPIKDDMTKDFTPLQEFKTKLDQMVQQQAQAAQQAQQQGQQDASGNNDASANAPQQDASAATGNAPAQNTATTTEQTGTGANAPAPAQNQPAQ